MAGASRRRAPAATARRCGAPTAAASPRAPRSPARAAWRTRPAAAPAGLRARPVPAAAPRPALLVPRLRGGGDGRSRAQRTPRGAVLLLGPRDRPPRLPRLTQRLWRRRRPGTARVPLRVCYDAWGGPRGGQGWGTSATNPASRRARENVLFPHLPHSHVHLHLPDGLYVMKGAGRGRLAPSVRAPAGCSRWGRVGE